MGDGETPTFSEAMALRNAKQVAIEQAGTYVQSYTQVRNLVLTADEINTIGGGVIETDIIEEKRVLEGNGIGFYVKIQARVTTDKMEDLANRVKGGNVVADYKRLQDDFAKLYAQLDLLKQQIPQAKTESDRAVVLERISEVEKQFRVIQSNERAFHKRLLSGRAIYAEVERQLGVDQAQAEEARKRRERITPALEHLLTTIRENGHTLEIGPPEVMTKEDLVKLRFLVTATVTQEARASIQELREASGDSMRDIAIGRIYELLNSLRLTLTVGLKNGSHYETIVQRFHSFRDARTTHLKELAIETPRTQYLWVDVPRNVIGEVEFVEGHISSNTATNVFP